MRKNVPAKPAPTRRPPSADALALRVLDGDELAFEQLHRRLGGGLRRFFQRRVRGQPDLVEELSQTTWVEVWRALHAGRYDPGRARISTFIYAVGYKMLLRHFRAAQRGPGGAQSVMDRDFVPTATAAAPDDLLHSCELIDAVRDCLRETGTRHGLTDEERVIVAGVVSGDSERALAERLGIAPSTVNARKRSAFEKLRACLVRKGFAREFAEREGPVGE